MNEIFTFGAVVAVSGAAVLLAVLSHRFSQRFHVPTPALFLIAAALGAALFPVLRSLPVGVDEQIVTVTVCSSRSTGACTLGGVVSGPLRVRWCGWGWRARSSPPSPWPGQRM